MIDKIDLMEELMEAERQIARGEVYTQEEAKIRIEENLVRWKNAGKTDDPADK